MIKPRRGRLAPAGRITAPIAASRSPRGRPEDAGGCAGDDATASESVGGVVAGRRPKKSGQANVCCADGRPLAPCAAFHPLSFAGRQPKLSNSATPCSEGERALHLAYGACRFEGPEIRAMDRERRQYVRERTTRVEHATSAQGASVEAT